MAKRSSAFTDGVSQSERRRLVQLAKLVPDQATLNTILLDVAHPIQRGAVFDLIKPHLRFEGDYPAWVASYRAPKPDPVKSLMDREKDQERVKKQWNH